ncbi:hypothetical protein EDD96_4074 [Streptomyces sp. Ag109_G2-6]|uniref:hypothetical protein n=1 Tax=Streptomyces sp. Ag109_G2-6 TaxID=2485154 RepID=UPI000F50280C|nr:hypothetical protein [Streptomyces sp. Ag109_G2-6]RPF40320.1 hypothetical protein EDD96_4074 [Streptomyces sp. Ag109_G2-6]
MNAVRAARIAAAAAVPGELVLVVCLASGVRPPGRLTAGVESAVPGMLLLEGWVLVSLRRRTGSWREAVRAVVPEPVRRLLLHELRACASLGRWVARRPHGVRPGDLAAAYTGPQTAMMYGLLFVSLIETVALALLIPWPAVHRVVLVLDVYGVLLVLALHTACVTRPHVVRPDGTLRIRYGALFDLTVPPEAVASVRVDRRYPEGRLVTLSGDGVLDLIVGSQTTVTLELHRPLEFRRPLGARARARTIRFHADDPRALVTALRRQPRARRGSSRCPGRPASGGPGCGRPAAGDPPRT